MEIQTFRAPSMQEALALVRRELGPDAAVLHTRQVRPSGLIGWLARRSQVEVTASFGVLVPSRLPAASESSRLSPQTSVSSDADANVRQSAGSGAAADSAPGRSPARPATADDAVQSRLDALQRMVEQLSRDAGRPRSEELPESLFRVFTDLIEAGIPEEEARGLIERVQASATAETLNDPQRVKQRIAELLEADVRVCGPIRPVPGERRLVALVGPTGVGKTTTVAKLAANFRLREKLKVGLITVDTYRIAAVEQLRTYADIIDLPMEIVSTPKEMRQAVDRLSDFDLVLLDTAGRSPRDEVKIQELKSLLAEARADEVYLVLSSVAGAEHLVATARKFAAVGTTALILTKLDEATGLGHTLPLLGQSGLPLSYVTDGQAVPDDIRVADRRALIDSLLCMEAAACE